MTKAESGRLGGLKVRNITVARNSKFVENYYNNPKLCKTCNAIIPYEKRNNIACGQSCGAKGNNNRKPKNPNLCGYCGVRCRSMFCTVIHFWAQRNKEYIELWKSGLESGGDKYLASPVRHYIFEKFDNKCSKCGWCEINPVTGISPLHIDHIDGNAENNREENLQLLCPNCHALTPTYGALNIGNGRAWRRDKYLREAPLVNVA